MASGKNSRSGPGAVEALQRVLALYRLVDERGVNPFEVEVGESLEELRRVLPALEGLEDLCLDAQAINDITKIIKSQGDWIKHRSSPLYTDPLILDLKIEILPPTLLADLFLRAWHPIVEMEQLTARRLKEAVDYWNSLLPLSERGYGLGGVALNPSNLTKEDLKRLEVVTEAEFTQILGAMWRELLEKAGEGGRVDYWDFVARSEFRETFKRAYYASFLVTYGYATLELKPLEEEIFLIPNKEITPLPKASAGSSIPIPLDRDSWMKYGRGKDLG